MPSLPVPALESTVAKYVDNARLFLSPQEFKKTQQEAELFLRGPGQVLQQKLLDRAEQKRKENKSWLIDWWNRFFHFFPIFDAQGRALSSLLSICRYAYMDYKESVVINVSYAFNFVEPRLGRVSQTRRAAQLIYGAVLFEQQLRKYSMPLILAVARSLLITGALRGCSETLEPDMGKDGPLCMNMYKLMFNTTRIPQPETDYWATYHQDLGEPDPIPWLRKTDFSRNMQTQGARYSWSTRTASLSWTFMIPRTGYSLCPRLRGSIFKPTLACTCGFYSMVSYFSLPSRLGNWKK